MTGFHDYGRKGTNLLKMKYSTTFSILKVQGFCNFHPSYPSQIRFLQVVVEKTQLNVLIKWEIISTPLTKQDENEKTPPFYHIISYHIISYHIISYLSLHPPFRSHPNRSHLLRHRSRYSMVTSAFSFGSANGVQETCTRCLRVTW